LESLKIDEAAKCVDSGTAVLTAIKLAAAQSRAGPFKQFIDTITLTDDSELSFSTPFRIAVEKNKTLDEMRKKSRTSWGILEEWRLLRILAGQKTFYEGQGFGYYERSGSSVEIISSTSWAKNFTDKGKLEKWTVTASTLLGQARSIGESIKKEKWESFTSQYNTFTHTQYESFVERRCEIAKSIAQLREESRELITTVETELSHKIWDNTSMTLHIPSMKLQVES